MRCVLASVALSVLAFAVVGSPAALRADTPPARPERGAVTAVAVLPERQAAVLWLPDESAYRLVEVGARAGDYEVLAVARAKVVLQRVPGGEVVVAVVTPPSSGGRAIAAVHLGPAAGPLDPYSSDLAATHRPAGPRDEGGFGPLDPYAAPASGEPLDPYPAPTAPPVGAAPLTSAPAGAAEHVGAAVGQGKRSGTVSAAHGARQPTADAAPPAVPATAVPPNAPPPAAPAPVTTSPAASATTSPEAPLTAGPIPLPPGPPGAPSFAPGGAEPAPTMRAPGLDTGAGPTGRRTERATFDRRDLSAALADFDRLAREIQVESHPRGLIVAGLARGSFLHRVGLRTGDVVTSVAGRSIASVDAAADVYARVLVADSFTIEVERSGTAISIECQVTGSR